MKATLLESIEPSELKRGSLSAADKKIMIENARERFQSRRTPVTKAGEDAIDREAWWIMGHVFEKEVHLTIAASIVVEEPKTKVTLTSSEDDWENSDKEFQRVDDENHEQTPISFDTAISISEEPRDESPAIVDHPNQNTSVDLNSTNSTLEAIATSTPQEAKLEK
ncbi:hypothetical protein CAEBREN_22777 [Caenorhabditis brenneri]|uniref:Uncharacterized protein n=1 Tax=Caenorhabditis brenneri TaxID=135651 RepID=G0NBB1_CAEBE|nr:hypothetical protein CAEBREN_22777 [Caenorhabditis brenneri]